MLEMHSYRLSVKLQDVFEALPIKVVPGNAPFTGIQPMRCQSVVVMDV